MVAGTGEAPSGIVAYESTGLPADYRGNLLVTSWGDHVDRALHAQPQRRIVLGPACRRVVRGGEDFRPVGIAVGPDGSRLPQRLGGQIVSRSRQGPHLAAAHEEAGEDDGLRPGQVAALTPTGWRELLGHPRQEIRQAATMALASKGQGRQGDSWPKVLARQERAARRSCRRCGPPPGWERRRRPGPAARWHAPEPEVRAEAVRLLPTR